MTTNQPVAISVAIGGLVTTGIALAAVLWPDRLTPELQAVIIAFANALILTAVSIWAANRSTPVGNPTLPANTEVKVQGTEDTVVVQPTPPGPTGIEGGAAEDGGVG
jgi:hypothetical protein